MAKHDPSQVGLPSTPSLGDHNLPTTAREDEIAVWQKYKDEGEKIASGLQADLGLGWVVTHGWAWKGYGYSIQAVQGSVPNPPSVEEIEASKRKSS